MTSYPELRAASKSMHTKMREATRPLDFHIVKIAKRMTLPVVGRTLIFDNEGLQNGLLDFLHHEYRVNGKSLLESAGPEQAGLTPLEGELLEAHLASRTSLLEAQKASRHLHQVHLRDVLEPGQPEIVLTDIGLSESLYELRARLVLFTRLVSARGITMTGGFSFGFEPERLPGLLQAYLQKMKKVTPEQLSEQRFIFFLQKHRQFGIEQRFQDVV